MRLTHKLTLAFLLVSLIGIGLAAAFIWGVTSVEFNRYLQNQRQNDFVNAARTYYEQNNTWAGVGRSLREQGLLPAPPQAGGAQQPLPPFALVDQNRFVIVPSAGHVPGEQVPQQALAQGIPIEVNGVVVGTLLNARQPLIRNAVEQQYVDAINRALWIAAVGGTLIALVLGIVLARTLTRPVNELTAATRAMAGGKLEQRVPVRTKDELGELAASFNEMSADLARANRARRQMTADIAHDLRNPLTVIAGYLESLKDGKLLPTPERIATMQTEVEHLERLVDDLRTLSLADAGELGIRRLLVAPSELLERVAAAYQPQAQQQGIRLKVESEPHLPQISLDPERMEQVLGNLVRNALRYTPKGGEIILTAGRAEGSLILGVQDDGSGISPEDLPHVFERSYRGDPSRSGGESGLGLAIAKSIMEAHGGSISVTSSPGHGSRFLLAVPSSG